MGKHLVIVGGGHAHLTILKNIDRFVEKGHRVTVVNASEWHYYSGMGPGMLSGIYSPDNVRFHVRKMVESRGGRFMEDTAIRISPEKRRIYLKSGDETGYDAVSFNTGSHIPFAVPPENNGVTVFRVKPIEKLMDARQQIIAAMKTRPLKICVAGGGPAGVEMAANIRRLVREEKGRADIFLVAGNRLLPGFAAKARQIAHDILSRSGVTVMEGVRFRETGNGFVKLSNGELPDTDFVFGAVGTRPSPLFRDSGLPAGPDDGLRVNACLQSVAYPEIFGGGDCISFGPRPLARVGVYAVRQNPVLLHNLMAILEGEALQRFVPQRKVMLILNMGDGTGLFMRDSLVWHGRAAFMLKDSIDRKFMRKFQE